MLNVVLSNGCNTKKKETHPYYCNDRKSNNISLFTHSPLGMPLIPRNQETNRIAEISTKSVANNRLS